MERNQLIELIESGQQVGFSELKEENGKSFSLTVGIQKDAGTYKTIYHFTEIDLSKDPKYFESESDVWGNQIFTTLSEAEQFILLRSHIKLEKLHKPMPTKVKKKRKL